MTMALQAPLRPGYRLPRPCHRANRLFTKIVMHQADWHSGPRAISGVPLDPRQPAPEACSRTIWSLPRVGVLSQTANSVCVGEMQEIEEVAHTVSIFPFLPFLPTAEPTNELQGG